MCRSVGRSVRSVRSVWSVRSAVGLVRFRSWSGSGLVLVWYGYWFGFWSCVLVLCTASGSVHGTGPVYVLWFWVSSSCGSPGLTGVILEISAVPVAPRVLWGHPRFLRYHVNPVFPGVSQCFLAFPVSPVLSSALCGSPRLLAALRFPRGSSCGAFSG